jgi:ribonuclease-3
MNELQKLEDRLEYKFRNAALILEALTHKSCKKSYNNERLEFLGDAVLDLIVGEYLFKKFPDVNEGDLSKLRASLVNEKGFQKLANSIDLGSYIFISAAEENNDGRSKSSICSNAFEALIGAIYLESGLEKAQEITLRLLEEAYPKIDLKSVFRDYKTTLQEITQAKKGVTPEYIVISASGPDHKKEFEVMIKVAGRELATAKGSSKKEAHQEAAKLALEVLKKEDD